MFTVIFILCIVIGFIDLAKTNQAKKENSKVARSRIARRNANFQALKNLQNKKY